VSTFFLTSEEASFPQVGCLWPALYRLIEAAGLRSSGGMTCVVSAGCSEMTKISDGQLTRADLAVLSASPLTSVTRLGLDDGCG